MVDRRELLLGVSAAAAVSQFLWEMTQNPAFAQAKPEQAWVEAYRKIIGDAKPVDGQIRVELPEIAENGNTVPFTAIAESPMTERDYVKALHVFATINPVPTIATFHFTPLSGAAGVSSRIRLAGTQDIVFLAAHSTGRFVMHRRAVKVTIGGCGG